MGFNIKPLSNKELKDYFYGREDELNFLVTQITKSEGGKAFAISGSRGSGKSTLINKLKDSLINRKENYLIVRVDVPKKFDELLLLKRILREVSYKAIEVLKGKNEGWRERMARKLIRLDYQTMQSRQFEAGKIDEKTVKGGIDFYLNIGKETTKSKVDIERTTYETKYREYDIESVQNDLQRLLEDLLNEKIFYKIVIIVDETDKSDYTEAVKILNDIKSLFWIDRCYYIFVGSEEFYEDYTRGIKTGKKTLLDSLFTRIIYLQPFDKDDIIELLKKRIGKEISEETNEVLDIISALSKGSPRDAVRYCDLLVGECGSIEDATLGDLGRIIQDTYPNFPRENIKYFIPLSTFISDVAPGHLDPIAESCAINIISSIMEMDPSPEEKDAVMVLGCSKQVIEDAIVGKSEEGKFSKTQFDVALAFLKELAIITEDKGENTLILEDISDIKYKRIFDKVI